MGKAAHEAILTPRDEPGHGGLGSNEMVDLLQETDKVLQEQCSELECRIDALEVALEEANKVKVDGSTQLGSRASTPGLAGFQRLAYRQELDLQISDRKDKIGSLQRKVQREKAEVSLLAPNKQGAALKNVQGLEHDLQGMEAVLKRIENAPVDGQYFQLQLEEQLAILNPMEGRVELLMEKIGALESLAEEPEDEKTGVADVANLESKMMANLKNMKENLNKEINSKAERHDLEEVLKEVVSTVESAALEPNEEAKVEALHAALNLIHREMQSKGDAEELVQIKMQLEQMEALRTHPAMLNRGGAATTGKGVCLSCDRPLDFNTAHNHGSPVRTPNSEPVRTPTRTPLPAGVVLANNDDEPGMFQHATEWAKAPHSRANHIYRKGPQYALRAESAMGGGLPPVDRRHRLKMTQGSRGVNDFDGGVMSGRSPSKQRV